jgi:hypothetical protein
MDRSTASTEAFCTAGGPGVRLGFVCKYNLSYLVYFFYSKRAPRVPLGFLPDWRDKMLDYGNTVVIIR